MSFWLRPYKDKNAVLRAMAIDIGVDFWEQPGCAPPIIEKRPCFHHLLPLSPIFYLPLPPIFLTSLRQWQQNFRRTDHINIIRLALHGETLLTTWSVRRKFCCHCGCKAPNLPLSHHATKHCTCSKYFIRILLELSNEIVIAYLLQKSLIICCAKSELKWKSGEYIMHSYSLYCSFGN